jgi:carbon dioxide concentrating mechanism protein CcmL
MFLCKVTGTVISTRKDDALRPAKMLIVHPVDTSGAVTGTRDYLALDPCYGAGVGDYVLVAREGAVVAQLMASATVPTNVIILGVVDDWSTIVT